MGGMQHVWARGEVHTGFWWGDFRKEEHLKGVDRKIKLKWIFTKWDEGMDWIQLAQNKDRWRDLVNIKATKKISCSGKVTKTLSPLKDETCLFYRSSQCVPSSKLSTVVMQNQSLYVV
jgi:hypothetical protein